MIRSMRLILSLYRHRTPLKTNQSVVINQSRPLFDRDDFIISTKDPDLWRDPNRYPLLNFHCYHLERKRSTGRKTHTYLKSHISNPTHQFKPNKIRYKQDITKVLSVCRLCKGIGKVKLLYNVLLLFHSKVTQCMYTFQL